MTRRRAAVVAVAVAVLSGCAGGDDDDQVDSTETSTADTSVTATTESADTAAASEPTEPSEPSTTPVATSVPTTAAEGVVPGTATITVVTEGSGLGARPLLRWEAVEAAASYVISVNAPAGGPLWAWEGSVTEIPFGGGPADDPDTTGAQLLGPATWFVAALDADGRVIATSAPADLAP